MFVSSLKLVFERTLDGCSWADLGRRPPSTAHVERQAPVMYLKRRDFIAIAGAAAAIEADASCVSLKEQQACTA
jgi:hypothetical protein